MVALLHSRIRRKRGTIIPLILPFFLLTIQLTLLCVYYRSSSTHSEEALLNLSGCTRQVCTSVHPYICARFAPVSISVSVSVSVSLSLSLPRLVETVAAPFIAIQRTPLYLEAVQPSSVAYATHIVPYLSLSRGLGPIQGQRGGAALSESRHSKYLITPFFCLPRLRAQLTLSCLFSSDISRAADISLKIYLRSEANSGTSGKNDPYMGSVKIRPEFTNFSRLVSTTFLHIFTQVLNPFAEYL